MKVTAIYVGEDEASEQCITPGWYLASDGFTRLADDMVVPFASQAEALAYIKSLTED